MIRFFFFLLIVKIQVNAEVPPRIQQLFLNRSTSQKIYLTPGLATSVKMPCEIDEIVTTQAGISKHISERNRARFSLEMTQKAQSTNFIVHCIEQTFVFDLIVNKAIHNDYIEVIGDYGSPRLTQTPQYHLKEKNIDIMSATKDVYFSKYRKNYELNQVNKVKVYSSDLNSNDHSME